MLSVSLSACVDGNDSSDNSSKTPASDVLNITSTSPTSDAGDVGTNIIAVTATFSEAMNAATLNNDSFTVGLTDGVLLTGTVDLDTTTNTAIFKLVGGGFGDTSNTYTATITTAAKSEDGKALATDYHWNFKIGGVDDDMPPTVTSSDPGNPDKVTMDVANNRNISASFSEAMYVPSINGSSFTVERNVLNAEPVPVAGTVKVIGNTAIFDPADDLATGTNYTATITTSVTDLANNALANNYIWSFTTGDSVAMGQAPVILGTAGNYVILAKAGITTTGETLITGDIAVSPIAKTSLSTFSIVADSTETFATSTYVNGKIYAADMAPSTPSMLTTVIGDMEIAYADAAGRTNPDYTELGAGDISGKTLIPGLYKWSSDLLITTGVTLNGSANDVWILQVAGDLTVGNGVAVTLSGGAMAKNVFWQVGGEITLGTTSAVEGILLSKTLIAIKTGAALNGRAFAQTAVTLDANKVKEPAQ